MAGLSLARGATGQDILRSGCCGAAVVAGPCFREEPVPDGLAGRAQRAARVEELLELLLRYGYEQGNYSLAVVAGIFKTIVAIILVGSANQAAKRLNQETLV